MKPVLWYERKRTRQPQYMDGSLLLLVKSFLGFGLLRKIQAGPNEEHNILYQYIFGNVKCPNDHMHTTLMTKRAHFLDAIQAPELLFRQGTKWIPFEAISGVSFLIFTKFATLKNENCKLDAPPNSHPRQPHQALARSCVATAARNRWSYLRRPVYRSICCSRFQTFITSRLTAFRWVLVWRVFTEIFPAGNSQDF